MTHPRDYALRYPAPPSPWDVPRSLVLTAVPVILFLATVCGSVGFFIGSASASPFRDQSRRARLPIARDRVLAALPWPRGASPGGPLVTQRFSLTAPRAPLVTNVSGNWVRIPALDVDVPLAQAASMSDPDVLEVLSRGVALYPNGITPGQPGNTFISGHSTGEPWKGRYRFAFLHIDKLRPGDVIHVDYEGSRYTYRITGQRTIDPRIAPSLNPSGTNPTLSLMACWPLWTTRYRLLQDAELIAVHPLVVTSVR